MFTRIFKIGRSEEFCWIKCYRIIRASSRAGFSGSASNSLATSCTVSELVLLLQELPDLGLECLEVWVETYEEFPKCIVIL
jgi:hypothetical protein